MIEDNRILFTSGFVYPMRSFSVFLGFQGEVTISCQEQQITVKYVISPLPQYMIVTLLFVLACVVFVLGPMGQIDARQFVTLQVAIVAFLGGLIITACFLSANMVLFPYRFDKFMQSYVREFLTVFQRIGTSSSLPGEETGVR